jgi:hypothetical protein
MVKAFFEVNFPDPRKIDESAQEVGMDTMEKIVLVISFANEVGFLAYRFHSLCSPLFSRLPSKEFFYA